MNRLLLSIFLATVSTSSSEVVADYKIRDPNITPALGRGFSLTSYDVLSTCLEFTEKTQATYNYDYDMAEFTNEGREKSKMSAGMQASISYPFIKGEISGAVSKGSSSKRKTHYVSTRMATERYYSSIDDTTASLTPAALALVQRGDLVGFFQACGSGFIRSIRRTAEISAVFAFSSTSETTSSKMAAQLTASSGGGFFGGSDFSVSAGADSLSDTRSTDTSMNIKIRGFGLGLNDAGAETLVATTLEDYHDALAFAFRSMQSDEVGMIHGVEVVSWMNNLQFQDAVRFVRTEMIAWVPQSKGSSDKVRGVAKGELLTPEKGTQGEDGYAPATHSPVWVEAIEVKAITMINAEFITQLEARYRKESRAVTRFIRCKAEVDALVTLGLGNYYLKDHTKMDFSMDARQNAWTVKQAHQITQKTENLNNRIDSLKIFVREFYGKCASEITKHSNDGRMTKYWWELEECLPTASGTPGDDNNPTLECIEGERDFVYDGKPPTLKCKQQTPPQGSTGTSGIGNFLDRYCLPEIDYSIDPANNNKQAKPSTPPTNSKNPS